MGWSRADGRLVQRICSSDAVCDDGGDAGGEAGETGVEWRTSFLVDRVRVLQPVRPLAPGLSSTSGQGDAERPPFVCPPP